MSKLTQGLLVTAVALAAATAGFAVNRAGKNAAPVDPASGAKLMALSLPDAENKLQAMSQWKGKIVVANFWATWCPPCREEIPGFVRLSKKYAAKGVQFVGISIDSADKVKDFAKEVGIDYPLLIAEFDAIQLTASMGNKAMALPFTAVLNRDGTTHFVKLGQLHEGDLDTILKRLK